MSRSTFEHRLHDLIEDGPTTAPPQLLDTVVATVPSIPQRRGAWRAPWRTSPMLGFARALAGVAIALALGSAVLFLLVLRPSGTVGSSPSPSTPIVAVATPSASASAPASPGAAPTPAPTPVATPVPTVAPCDPAKLAARITMWEGAAGSRIAQLEMTNTGSSSCTIRAMERPQLVDGSGKVLIDGPAASASSTLRPRPRTATTVVPRPRRRSPWHSSSATGTRSLPRRSRRRTQRSRRATVRARLPRSR